MLFYECVRPNVHVGVCNHAATVAGCADDLVCPAVDVTHLLTITLCCIREPNRWLLVLLALVHLAASTMRMASTVIQVRISLARSWTGWSITCVWSCIHLAFLFS